MIKFKNSHPLIHPLLNALSDLPSPSNISLMWNLGSLLGLCLTVQLLTGIFLSMHYTSDASLAFWSVVHIQRDVNYGWLLRMIHANGASIFFMVLYLHVGRGIYYMSYKFSATWSVGVILLLMVMATSFFGYVLPWGQMSFWGTAVITNLISAIPYAGDDIVRWVWGGFAVANATLTRFFTFHFMLPFLVVALVLIHLIFLHQTGSTNPLGLSLNSDKLSFHPYFSFKDTLGVILVLFLLLALSLYAPWALGDPENFLMSNPLVTPIHIQPEWYFLFAYAILRAIPNKLGGVLALAGAIMILFILPLFPTSGMQGMGFYPLNKLFFWILVMIFFLLIWIGARPVEDPYVITGQILSFFYFSMFFMIYSLVVLWDFLLK